MDISIAAETQACTAYIIKSAASRSSCKSTPPSTGPTRPCQPRLTIFSPHSARHQLLRRSQKRNAGLYRRLVCALNAIQQKQNSHQQRHQRHPAQRQRKQRDKRCSEKSSTTMMLRLFTLVLQRYRHGRKHHHGRKLPAETSPQQRGRTGLIKQIQRQCKTQHRVAEQR